MQEKSFDDICLNFCLKASPPFLTVIFAGCAINFFFYQHLKISFHCPLAFTYWFDCFLFVFFFLSYFKGSFFAFEVLQICLGVDFNYSAWNLLNLQINVFH